MALQCQIFIFGLCSSTPGHMPFQFFPSTLILSFLGPILTSCLFHVVYSSQRVSTDTPLRFSRSPVHDSDAHLASLCLVMWQVHCHFSSAILSMMSFTLVLLWISSFLILSLWSTPRIALSIALYITRSLLALIFVKANVSNPYIDTGRTQIS